MINSYQKGFWYDPDLLIYQSTQGGPGNAPVLSVCHYGLSWLDTACLLRVYSLFWYFPI